MTSRPQATSVFVFFGLVFLISAPFWALGHVTSDQFLPGLPVSSLMVLVPTLVAGVLVVRSGGVGTVWRFLAQAFDAPKLRLWVWVATFGTMPGVMLLSALWLNASGTELPPFEFDLGRVLVLFALFFVAATLEELGWTGFVTQPLLKRLGVLTAGLIIGAVAAIWHLLPLLQVDRAWDWIAWWALGTIARRVLIVWIYARGGQSVFGASLFHTMSNLSWMMFPVMGSHYDPMRTAIILAVLALLAVISELLRSKKATPQNRH